MSTRLAYFDNRIRGYISSGPLPTNIPRVKVDGVSASVDAVLGAWTLAIAQGIKLSALAGMIVAYPTRAEAGKRAAGSFFVPKLFAAGTKRLLGWLAKLP